LLLVLYFGCTTNERSIPFGYLLHPLVQGHHGPLLCSGVFIAEEDDEIGDKGSGDNKMVDVDTLAGLSEHVPEICLFH
jgi:hypothetical protein